MSQSYSVQDALDREAMSELDQALLLVHEKISALKKRGFTVKLCQLVDVIRPDGKPTKEWKEFTNSWNAEIDGRLTAAVTKQYRLPYEAAP